MGGIFSTSCDESEWIFEDSCVVSGDCGWQSTQSVWFEVDDVMMVRKKGLRWERSNRKAIAAKSINSAIDLKLHILLLPLLLTSFSTSQLIQQCLINKWVSLHHDILSIVSLNAGSSTLQSWLTRPPTSLYRPASTRTSSPSSTRRSTRRSRQRYLRNFG